MAAKKKKITMDWPEPLAEKVSELLRSVTKRSGHELSRTEFTLEAVHWYLEYLGNQETDKAILSVLIEGKKK